MAVIDEHPVGHRLEDSLKLARICLRLVLSLLQAALSRVVPGNHRTKYTVLWSIHRIVLLRQRARGKKTERGGIDQVLARLVMAINYTQREILYCLAVQCMPRRRVEQCLDYTLSFRSVFELLAQPTSGTILTHNSSLVIHHGDTISNTFKDGVQLLGTPLPQEQAPAYLCHAVEQRRPKKATHDWMAARHAH